MSKYLIERTKKLDNDNLYRALGICIGASTISFVETQKLNGAIQVLSQNSIIHEGNPKKILTEYFKQNNFSQHSVIATGRKFKQLLNCVSIPEPEAIEESVQFLSLNGKYRVLASLGGENFIVYCLNEKGRIESVLTGNKCASGTGEFFLQQIGRMNLSINEALDLADHEAPHQVSGRCSVFCKSDCTHALNKGTPKGFVVAGLSQMIANKTLELLSKQNSKDVLVIGGVSQNESVIKFIREEYPNIYIPQEATYFEALGASLIGLKRLSKIDHKNIFKENHVNFAFLEPLNGIGARVTFKEIRRAEARTGDVCLLGLDVGSTTTKAVLIRKEDSALLASIYLRTNGNPIQASIECYKEIQKQIVQSIKIIGLGTTGSGRHISALHALTKGVVNEIIAHAVAAAYFDKDVDTIFEIGGQDAKYTYLTNGIASDYAMNEACSAGTGSFLEESANETLNIFYKDIGDTAFKAKNPLNFNDQCAAFISSDIKNASHNGATKEDIVAGLVYSICMNYVNRVKGNRPVGKKVFMQGGVCYNRAVPYAMSNLINKEIVVPPEPGLMGAFGAALEIKNRLELGLLEEDEFNLDYLIDREFNYGHEFICAGGKEKCDRKCAIAVIEVEGKKYPFGGACNKYYNERHHINAETTKNDFVRIRQDLVFNKYLTLPQAYGKTIGITRSFQTNSLYPLYYNFFTKLGFKIVLSDEINHEGVDKMRSSFCYPVEISHGFFQDLLNKNVDYIFLPHVSQMYSINGGYNKLCVFVQGESYYLKSTFRDEKLPNLLTPIIDFSKSHEEIQDVFVSVGRQLGKSSRESKEAFRFAHELQLDMLKEFKEIGKRALARIEEDKSKFGMVLFGRSYSAFAREANMNIPHKFASKDIMIIPHDFLTFDQYKSFENMYWDTGQQVLRGARFVKNHKQLFGVYITNFSCGPDSFIIPYFRKIMGTKPSLTLELDSHSADVGIDTRIDAAIDIIKNYIQLNKEGITQEEKDEVKIFSIEDELKKVDFKSKQHPLLSKDIEVMIPSMGRFGTESFSAVFRSFGVNCKPMPIPTQNTLKYGRGSTSCKECLPFILTTGSLVEYVTENNHSGKKILFFMPHGYGPCRQGQYFVMLKEVIKDLKLENIGVLSMDEEGSFEELGSEFFRRGWIVVLISDIVTDIHNALLALAVNREYASEILDREWELVLCKIEEGKEDGIYDQLEVMAEVLSHIPLKESLEDAKVISIVGEIYVRHEEFSRMDLIKILVEKGFVVKVAPVSEYVYYSNYLIKKGITIDGMSFKERSKIFIKDKFQRMIEKKIKKILSKSGLVNSHMTDIEDTISYANNLISEELTGESILTTGLALREILDDACGVISFGPFNCMPSRLSEAILNKEMTLEGKHRNSKFSQNGYPQELNTLPFLYVETDGNAFPQITQSRIEIFMMQAEKVHEALKNRITCK